MPSDFPTNPGHLTPTSAYSPVHIHKSSPLADTPASHYLISPSVSIPSSLAPVPFASLSCCALVFQPQCLHLGSQSCCLVQYDKYDKCSLKPLHVGNLNIFDFGVSEHQCGWKQHLISPQLKSTKKNILGHITKGSKESQRPALEYDTRAILPLLSDHSECFKLFHLLK